MLNYLLEKCKQWVFEALDDFIRDFQSTFEANWDRFVKVQMKRLKESESKNDMILMGMTNFEMDMVKDLHNEIQTIFSIIIRLPIRREVKNEISYVKSKVM